ncbi:MAG: family 16 glycosylhydrolase, partial [Candidatus Methanomethylophilaceae archaeon]|nr:family 16 glycosylhydrolase [Candidatus Methanomethylophilaceae archaeon]
NFQREGIPETDARKSCYGVTANGTVYFYSPSPMMYLHMWQLFLEEFFGVPYGSGEQSGGCAVTECYRELPNFNEAWLRQQGYENVFTDEFDGDALNLDVWEYRANGARRIGYNAPSQVSVKDGNLVMTGEYRTDGEYGEGWYGAMIALKQWYRRGYFKATIKCNERIAGTHDFWAAFWIQGSSPYDAEKSQGGIGEGGAEIDILENWGTDVASSTVWVTGYEDSTDLESYGFEARLGNDYMQDYHTFALLWDEYYYRFYVDDILVGYTNFGNGTSRIEEQVIVSLEIPGEMDIQPGAVREMLVNSIEIWQKPAAEE